MNRARAGDGPLGVSSTRPCPLWVKRGRTRHEHLLSAFDLIPDEQADIRAGRLSANKRHSEAIRLERILRTQGADVGLCALAELVVKLRDVRAMCRLAVALYAVGADAEPVRVHCY